MKVDALPPATGDATPPARAMRDEVLELADGTKVRLGDLPPAELKQLSRLLRRIAERPDEEPT